MISVYFEFITPLKRICINYTFSSFFSRKGFLDRERKLVVRDCRPVVESSRLLRENIPYFCVNVAFMVDWS